MECRGPAVPRVCPLRLLTATFPQVAGYRARRQREEVAETQTEVSAPTPTNVRCEGDFRSRFGRYAQRIDDFGGT
jgi:hypothetical protein